MKSHSSLMVVILSSLLASIVAVPYPTFEEGDSNTTINVAVVLNEKVSFSCTVINDTESEFNELNGLPIPVSGENNWEWKKDDGDNKVQLVIEQVASSNEGSTFTCEAIDTENRFSSLSYHIAKVYDGTTFKEGNVNGTVITGLTKGTKAEIRCTIDKADPPITELSIAPQPVGNEDYKVIGEGLEWIGIEFNNINDLIPVEYTCSAKSNTTFATLTYALTLFDGITFKEGATNSSTNQSLITETTNTITCSVSSADPPLLAGTESLIMEPEPLPGNEDYKFEHVNNSVVVKFLKINDNTPTIFKCTAKNNMTTATLSYNLLIRDPVAPVFTFGGNETIWTEIGTGVNHTFQCTVIKGFAVPEVTGVIAEPPEESNWKIIKNDDFSVEIQITGADSLLNKKDYICIASNGVRTTQLIYQNFVGGPPASLDVSIDSVISKNKITFSMKVTDRNTAPARFIMVEHKGLMDNNVSLAVPQPDSYDDELTYAFANFMTHELSDVEQHSELSVYANNTLGDVFIKTYSVAIPKRKSSPNSGAIAAGILVPFFLILGGSVVAVVLFYFWKKNKTGKSISFSKISGGDNIEDAKSTYGAL